MAFDGIVIANLVRDFKESLEGGRVTKIAQPEKDELLFTIKSQKNTYRLLISASATALLHGEEQAQPPDGSQLLHAPAQTHRERPHRLHLPAWAGAGGGV